MTAAKKKRTAVPAGGSRIEQPIEQIATPGAAVGTEEVQPPASSVSARPVWEGGESRSQFHDRVRTWKLAQAR